MNILSRKISEIPEFSKHFKKVAQDNNWIYFFDIIHHIDDLASHRGVGKKTLSTLEFILEKHHITLEILKKELGEATSKVSEIEIKLFSKIISSKTFKKLNNLFIDLQKKGFSNSTILLSLPDEEIGILYKPGARGMNNQVFLQTFKRTASKDKEKLLNYLNQNQKLFMKAYQEKIFENFRK